ncbi:MAG: hypothetical protein ILA06_04315 [Bacteroidaceae bacterium]|nr:hypothetical protein [Bacteroidaceae bacterium]
MKLNRLSSTAPDYVFVDTILLAYRLGLVRHGEQRDALTAAARTATDAISFLTTLDAHGIKRHSRLYTLVSEILAAPAYYRAQYPLMLGLRSEGQEAPSFLSGGQALSLPEPLFTAKQQKLFYETYWWFVRNYQDAFYDPKRGHCIGAYANDPKDNSSVLANFNDYLSRLMGHSSQQIRERYEGFPADIVMAILERAFL